MVILNYIHRLNDNDLVSDYLRRAVNSLAGKAEVYVITRDDNYQESLDGKNPDIVHIHGCWDRYAFQLMKEARRQGRAVVISPHWEIGTYAMSHEQHLRKLANLAEYQRWMIANCEALLVTTDEERDQLLSLGWKSRIDTIKASILDSTMSDAEMGDWLLWFYQKVVDTRYQLLMTGEERSAVCSLLHVGTAHDEKRTLLSSDNILTIRNLTPTQWRRVLLYGDDEDIRLLIDAAAERMQLSIPAVDTSKISRYPLDKPKTMGELPSSRLIGGMKIKSRELREITENDSHDLQALAVMLINARTLLRKQQMSLRQLTELYDKIKYADYDETRFVEITKELKINKFMRRMLQVMADELYLEEGFMPDRPLSDRLTARIKRVFTTPRI